MTDLNLSSEARLTLADLRRAANELAYLNAPVECRTSPLGLHLLRLMVDPILQPHDHFSITGLRIIVDPTMPGSRIEFRDQYGKVTNAFELQVSRVPPRCSCAPGLCWRSHEPRD
jgi:hypothetical protein